MTQGSDAKPRALVFDWDNTLVDSWTTIHEALHRTFTAMGHVPWTLAETKTRVRHSLRDAFPALFGVRWEEARQLYLDHFTAIHIERLTPIIGAAELLAEAKGRGLHLAVLSNKTGRILRLEAEHLGWSGHFARLVGAGDASGDKPDPVAMLYALEGSGLAGPEVWYVGDTALDMECAARAGCVGVLLGAGDPEDQAFVKFPPQRRFADFTALGRWLRNESDPPSSGSR
ncbi:MAG TPA: HAD family hydrolase [Stellaceae bacterium]|jgi:phosphoglycolate phosphatase